MSEAGPRSQVAITDHFHRTCVAADGVLVAPLRQQVSRQIEVSAITLSGPGKGAMQGLEGGFRVADTLQHEMDISRQQQGIASLVAARRCHRDRRQQALRRGGITAGKQQLRQQVPPTAGFHFVCIGRQKLVVNADGIAQVPGADVVGCGRKQRRRGELGFTVKPLHVFIAGSGATKGPDLLQTIGSFPPGIGGRHVFRMYFIERFKCGYGVGTPLAPRIGPGQ